MKPSTTATVLIAEAPGAGSTRRLSHERIGRMLAGASVIGLGALAWAFTPLWLVPLGLVGTNLVVSGATNACPMKSLLVRLGVPGERDLGHAEARHASRRRGPLVSRLATKE